MTGSVSPAPYAIQAATSPRGSEGTKLWRLVHNYHHNVRALQPGSHFVGSTPYAAHRADTLSSGGIHALFRKPGCASCRVAGTVLCTMETPAAPGWPSCCTVGESRRM